MENRKATEAGQDVTMQKEDFAVLWKTIHLKVTDTYEVPPEILWVNGSTIGTLGNFSASTGKAKSKKTFNISAIVAAASELLSDSFRSDYQSSLPQYRLGNQRLSSCSCCSRHSLGKHATAKEQNKGKRNNKNSTKAPLLASFQ